MSFIQDLNTLAGSVSGAAQSLTGLYQTRTALERDRLKSQLRVLEDETISRMFLPEGDPRKIRATDDTWRAALDDLKQRQEEVLGDVRWRRVAGSVRSELDPEISGFNRRFGEAMYAAERKYDYGVLVANIDDYARAGDLEKVRESAKMLNVLSDDPVQARAILRQAETNAGTVTLQRKIGQPIAEQAEDGLTVLRQRTFREALSAVTGDKDVPQESRDQVRASLFARLESDTKNFDSVIDDLLAEQSRTQGTVNLGMLNRVIQEAEGSGYVKPENLQAAMARREAYLTALDIQNVNIVESEFMTKFAKQAVPQGAEQAYVDQLDKMLRSEQFQGKPAAAEAIRQAQARIRAYAEESAAGGGDAETSLAIFNGEWLDLQNVVNNGGIGADAGIYTAASLRMRTMQEARDAVTVGDARKANTLQRLVAEMDKTMTDWSKSGGEMSKYYLKMTTDQQAEMPRVLFAHLQRSGQADSPVGKVVGAVLKDGNKASEVNKNLYATIMNDIMRMMGDAAKREDATPQTIQAEARRAALLLSDQLSVMPRGEMIKAGLFPGQDQETRAAKAQYALETIPAEQSGLNLRGTETLGQTVEQVKSIASRLVSYDFNREELAKRLGISKGEDLVLAPKPGAPNDLVIQTRGKTYQVNASPNGQWYISDGDVSVELKTERSASRASAAEQAKLEEQARVAREASALVRLMPRVTTERALQLALAQARLSPSIEVLNKMREQLGIATQPVPAPRR